MASAISEYALLATRDGIATLRRSFRGVRGDYVTWSVAVKARRIMATPKLRALRQTSLFTLRGTSCIFSRCRRGRGRCGRLCRRSAAQSEMRLVLLRD